MLLGRPIAPTRLLINEGVRRLKAAGPDVVLIDPQYAPKVIARHDEHNVDLMVALISTASHDMNINLFQRFALRNSPRVWSTGADCRESLCGHQGPFARGRRVDAPRPTKISLVRLRFSKHEIRIAECVRAIG